MLLLFFINVILSRVIHLLRLFAPIVYHLLKSIPFEERLLVPPCEGLNRYFANLILSCVYYSWTHTAKVDSPRHFTSAAGRTKYLQFFFCRFNDLILLSLLKWLIGKQIKEQANFKASLDGGVKSILEELSKDFSEEKLQSITLMLKAIPEQVESALQKMQREIYHTFTRESQVLSHVHQRVLSYWILSFCIFASTCNALILITKSLTGFV